MNQFSERIGKLGSQINQEGKNIYGEVKKSRFNQIMVLSFTVLAAVIAIIIIVLVAKWGYQKIWGENFDNNNTLTKDQIHNRAFAQAPTQTRNELIRSQGGQIDVMDKARNITSD